MCGIAGVIDGTTNADLHDVVRAMADTLQHRGPDEDRYFVDPGDHLALGHRRLSIIDLSPAGAQPMHSASGRWVVAYNGEIYNHHELRNALGGAIAWRGHSDTETLVEAIDAWGVAAALSRTEGMFAIAAYDTQDRQLVLARDRLGEKPLYWTQQDGRVAFASQLAGLRRVPGLRLDIDPSSAAALLRWSFVPHPHTIYTGVHQLSPGHLLEFDLQRSDEPATEREWWSLADTICSARMNPFAGSLADATHELRSLLRASVAARLESDVPLGAFLSGGIDSSLIAATAQEVMGDTRLRTFTVSMPSAGLDEAQHAVAVAAHLGTEHDTLNMHLDETLRLIPQLPQMWDEPFADPSMLPSALLCRAAREHVTVCLGGDGGDELFAGYNRHALGVSVDRIGRFLPPWARRGLSRTALALPSAGVDFVGRHTPGARVPNLADKLQKAGMLLSDVNPVWEQLAGVWPENALGSAPHRPRELECATPIGRVEKMMVADTASVLPDQMLVKVDRASMAASLEVRSPLLDTKILEWSWSLPIAYKARRGVGKLVMRRLAAETLPPYIAKRRKLGFDPPLAGWLRNELRPWAEQLLAAPRCVSEGWLDGEALRAAWAEHVSGHRNWEYRLWAVLMLEAWLAEHHPA